MIRLWLRFFKQCFKLLGTFCFGLFIFVLYLLFTPQGSELCLTLLSEWSPYQIQYTHFSGYLARQAHFDNLQISGKHLLVKADSLDLKWIAVDLLRPTKSLQSVEAIGLEVHYDNPQVHADPSSALFPFAMVVEDLTVKKAKFNINHHVHDVDFLQLKHAGTRHIEDLKEIHYKGSMGTLDVELNTRLDATWDLAFQDAPYFTKYLQGAVKTHGHVRLPKRKWRDPNNEVEITLIGDQANLDGTLINAYTLYLTGTLANHSAELSGKINKIPFDMNIKGKLSRTGWQGHAKECVLHHALYEGLGSSSAKINLDWAKEDIQAQINLLLGNKQSIDADFSIKKDAARTLKGSVSADLPQIKSLAAWFPELKRVRGSANIKLQVSGKLKDPHYTGDLIFRDLKISSPYLKKRTSINLLTVHLSEKQIIDIKGDGSLGEGHFSLQGNGSLEATNRHLRLGLKGENLLLSDTAEYYIVGNPDLTLTLQNKGSKLEGQIFVPHAEIKSFKNSQTLTPSKDVVLISKKTIEAEHAPSYSFSQALTTSITIVLGDKITYEGYGIKTKAKGQLWIKQSPGQPTKAKGRITLVKGKYRAYGKKFDISEGELLFNGGIIENPTLNIRAERKIKVTPSMKTFHAHSTIKAGVRFAGPLKNSKIEFYSTPTMPTADIISYLVLGQPQSEVSASQAGILFEALSQLTIFSGKKRNDIQMSLAEQLKLDQFGFSKKEKNSLETNTLSSKNNMLEDTVFVMGKQLSDRLYLHYSMALVDPSKSLGLRYFITKNLILEASAGKDDRGKNQASADLLLTFEGH